MAQHSDWYRLGPSLPHRVPSRPRDLDPASQSLCWWSMGAPVPESESSSEEMPSVRPKDSLSVAKSYLWYDFATSYVVLCCRLELGAFALGLATGLVCWRTPSILDLGAQSVCLSGATGQAIGANHNSIYAVQRRTGIRKSQEVFSIVHWHLM